MNTKHTQKSILILGGTGKTGRRIVQRLQQKDIPVKIGSRSAVPSFDWNNETNWDACLENVESVYVNYSPDLAVPGATHSIKSFVEKAKQHGVKHLVLLSGRGELEAQNCEQIIQNSGIDWTIVRASWFNQNFSEGAFVDMVKAGQITLPAGDIQEPFVDVDDIADVAVAALTDTRHYGKIYEVTGPRLMTLERIAEELSAATGREINYIQVPHQAFVDGVKNSGASEQVVWLMDYLFSTVLDGRNANLTHGIEQALGRKPKDFSQYAKETAATGLWSVAA